MAGPKVRGGGAGRGGGPLVSLTVEGMAELDSQLRRLVAVADDATLDEALLAGMEPIRAETARLTPRSKRPGGTTGKGHAADKIVAQIKQSGKRGEIGPLKDFWYIQFAEYGTPWSAAVGMFRSAADSHFIRAVAEFKSVLMVKIRRIAA